MSLKGKQLLFLESPVARLLPDGLFLKWKFRLLMGRRLDLRNPLTFSEKLQWLKINDRNSLYTRLVDKAEVKSYVAEKIGADFLIPTLGLWDNAESIDFDSLPEKFVLKCTHDSGSAVICTSKEALDREAAKRKLSASLSHNYWWTNREWPYRGVKPRIIAEPYVVDSRDGQLRDYKFFCFNGKPEFMFIATDREAGDTKFDFFDMDYNHLPFLNGHPNADVMPTKPEGFERMKELAAKLSEGMKHVRVDFYEADGKIYFGEYTFYHWSGMVPFEPQEWDERLGKLFR